jgi:hypothetical protein
MGRLSPCGLAAACWLRMPPVYPAAMQLQAKRRNSDRSYALYSRSVNSVRVGSGTAAHARSIPSFTTHPASRLAAPKAST